MGLSAFGDKDTPPNDRSLKATLGRAHPLWSRLRNHLQNEFGPLAEEWHFSGKAYGWSFRLKQPKRVLVYMTPCRAHFLASFVLGERACSAAHDARLPEAVLNLIDRSPKYVEGRGLRIPVRTAKDLHTIQTLAAIKAAH
jgi:hypothetical protein